MTTVSTRSGRPPRLAILLAGWLLAMTFSPGLTVADGAELLMFEQKGCPFCARFEREIAPGYPMSAAGALAPLRHVNIADSRTGDIAGLDPAVFVPTFVLVDGDREIGRLVGYPGSRYFYSEIQALIDQMPDRPKP
jgi:hypothetical protein